MPRSEAAGDPVVRRQRIDAFAGHPDFPGVAGAQSGQTTVTPRPGRPKSGPALSTSRGIKAGLRAKEIASICWSMITDPEGHVADAMELQDSASKGNGGRTIPLHKDLRAALIRLKEHTEARRALLATSGLKTMRLPASMLSGDWCNSVHSARSPFLTQEVLQHLVGKLEDTAYDLRPLHDEIPRP